MHKHRNPDEAISWLRTILILLEYRRLLRRQRPQRHYTPQEIPYFVQDSINNK